MLLFNTVDNLDKNKFHIPIWFMRQAGRYLPEYQKIKATCSSFLEMCYNPEKASEVTLQPISRFDLDAAIIFSDILVIPESLGFNVEFKESIGPVISDVDHDFCNLSLKNQNTLNLEKVYEAIRITRRKLAKKKSLIGFCGCPFTLACYILEGGSSKDFHKTKSFMYNNKIQFDHLVNILVDAAILHLGKQIESCCDIVQLFESHSGVLDDFDYDDYVINPTVKICEAIREKYPDAKISWFPRNSFGHYLKYFEDGHEICDLIDILSVDFSTSFELVAHAVDERIVLQGNLDPAMLLCEDFSLIESKVSKILEALKWRIEAGKFIFNLGHGVSQYTNPENIKKLVSFVRNYSRTTGFHFSPFGPYKHIDQDEPIEFSFFSERMFSDNDSK